MEQVRRVLDWPGGWRSARVQAQVQVQAQVRGRGRGRAMNQPAPKGCWCLFRHRLHHHNPTKQQRRKNPPTGHQDGATKAA